MKAALKRGVETGELVQVKASYKLSADAKKKMTTKRKPVAKKAATTKKKKTAVPKKKVSKTVDISISSHTNHPPVFHSPANQLPLLSAPKSHHTR